MRHVFSSSPSNQNNITMKQAMISGGKWNAAVFIVVSVHERLKIIELYLRLTK